MAVGSLSKYHEHWPEIQLLMIELQKINISLLMDNLSVIYKYIKKLDYFMELLQIYPPGM